MPPSYPIMPCVCVASLYNSLYTTWFHPKSLVKGALVLVRHCTFPNPWIVFSWIKDIKLVMGLYYFCPLRVLFRDPFSLSHWMGSLLNKCSILSLLPAIPPPQSSTGFHYTEKEIPCSYNGKTWPYLPLPRLCPICFFPAPWSLHHSRIPHKGSLCMPFFWNALLPDSHRGISSLIQVFSERLSLTTHPT